MTKFGIDLSRWQGWPDDPVYPSDPPNWPLLASQGVLFAGIRATVGDYYTDPMFGWNYDNAVQVGIIPIPYWVLQTNLESDAQAERYLNTLDGRKTWVDVADVEVLNSGSLTSRGRALHYGMDSIESETHAMQWIYTRKYFWDANMPSGFLEDFNDRPLWVASYGRNDGLVPASPPYPMLPDDWDAQVCWQYTEKCKDQLLLSAVASLQLDLNLMTDAMYNALLVRSGITPPVVTLPDPVPTPEPDPAPVPGPTPNPDPVPLPAGTYAVTGNFTVTVS